jgi:hypothetical protein
VRRRPDQEHVLGAWLALLLAATPAAAQTPSAPAPAPASPATAGSSRLFIGPTGRMLAPGQGYLTFDAIFATTLQIGVTPWLSAGIGTVPIFFLDDDFISPFWVTPKVRLYTSGRTSVAGGVVHAFAPSDNTQFGFGYVASTTGTAERSFTIGGGVLYGWDEDESDVTPVVQVAVERRFMPRVSFIGEGYVGPDGGLASGGFRWHFRRWQIDLAGLLPWAYDEGAIGGLWFSFAYKFGNQ